MSDAPAARLGVSEGRMLFLVSAVQFVNILDFMIVMPLGPDFARALGIPMSKLGVIGGSYTAAAAVAGLVASRFLDRYDRRSALGLAMLGLGAGTLAGGFATGLGTLVLARVLAGCFGGPATSLSLSIVADLIPAERRGKALGVVMGAFSAASVLGVPAGLELARLYGWRAPFFAVAAMSVIVTASAITLMPSLRLHLEGGVRAGSATLGEFLSSRSVLLALAASVTVMLSTFSLVPNFSAYVQHNLGYPRDHLGTLYLVGGVVSFVATQMVGSVVDRLGAAWISLVGAALFGAVTFVTFVEPLPGMPVAILFVAFMSTMAFRAVPLNTLSSRVPLPHERARFMSIQSASQHLASATGAVLASQALTELPDHRLSGMAGVGVAAIACGLFLPVLLFFVERELVSRAARADPRG